MHNIMTLSMLLALLPIVSASYAAGDSRRGTLTPVPFTDVHITDDFWSDRIEINRAVTIPYDFAKCEETGRLSNFAKAGGRMEGNFEGIYYNDSDVYKVIEGAAYSLAAHPDPKLERFLDDLIADIASAQEPDGYLNTFHTLVEPQKKWINLGQKHELYCAGHLFEAAVAHHQATGKRSLLDVAIKFADHIDSIFGLGKRHDVPGHEEIEIGLVKLYRTTADKRYLDLAEFFIDQRGRGERRELYGQYCQDHLPVTEHDAPVGHAVRAMYLYCGMADVAALTGDEAYLRALDRIWENEVQGKLYLTGGVGARHAGEAFGDDYELPNASAYNETCAAIGNAMWNHRMNLLHADAKYVDVLERVIYNGFLSGVSLTGDRFFYPNPLSSKGSYHRSPWFSCSCCPVNVVRFVPSIPGYIYACDDDGVYVNLFAAGNAQVKLPATTVSLEQKTRYPWDGEVTIIVRPERSSTFDLNIRIPGWATGSPVPSDLYSYEDQSATTGDQITFTVNGEPIPRFDVDRGYARLHRRWSPGDVVTLNLPMPIRIVRSHDSVEENHGRIAIERGPIVYCIEAADTDGYVRHLWLPSNPELSVEHRDELLGGVTVITGTAMAMRRTDDDDTVCRSNRLAFTAIPYYAWDQRSAGEMAVWLPASADLAEPIPPPTLASSSLPSASHCFQMDSVLAMNDQIEPASSIDHEIPRLTWWDHRGTKEWVQYAFPHPRTVSETAVYWFDDTGVGQCRLPASWKLLYKTGNDWKQVTTTDDYPVKANSYNRITFDPVRTSALRIEIQLQDGFSGGILEWRIN